jgi:hypothetical protein
MNRLLTNLFVLPAFLLLAACAASNPGSGPATSAQDTTRPATSTTKNGQSTAAKSSLPAEDLSKFRPTFTLPAAPRTGAAKTYVPPTNAVNAQIDQRLRDQAVANQSVKYAQGYRIQAYVGLERDQAMAIRRSVISRYPDETDYLTFKQPIYRLFIGDYLTRLEAEQAMLRIRPLAPKAELQVTQVLLNKTKF